MSIHFHLNLYWLLLPLAGGLLWWAFAERGDERGYFAGIGLLWRLPVAGLVFVLVLCGLLAVNLWLK